MRLKASANPAATDEGREVNTVADLRAACPDLVAQIEADARTAAAADGAKAERERISAIMAVSIPEGVEVDRAAACADPAMTAGSFALVVLNAVSKAAAAPPQAPAAAAAANPMSALFSESFAPVATDDAERTAAAARPFEVAGVKYGAEDLQRAVASVQRNQRH